MEQVIMAQLASGTPLTRRELAPTSGRARFQSGGPPRHSYRGTYQRDTNRSVLTRYPVHGNQHLSMSRKRMRRMDSPTRTMTFRSRHTGGKEPQRGIMLTLPGPPRSSNRKTWECSERLELLASTANTNPKRRRTRSQARPHRPRMGVPCASRIRPSLESHRTS